jgi:hypothetical protein
VFIESPAQDTAIYGQVVFRAPWLIHRSINWMLVLDSGAEGGIRLLVRVST